MIDQAVLETLQYQLMEPPDLGATWPSGLWSQAEVLARLNERQDRLLKSSHLMIGLADLPVLANVSRVALPQDWLLTFALYWRGDDGTVRPLVRASTFEADHAQTGWTTTADVPTFYSDNDQPLLQVTLIPAPTVAGTLLLLYVPAGATLDGTGEFFSVADEMVDGVRYGALADLLLKEGRGRSPERAGYAESRFALTLAASDLILRSLWVG